MDFGIPKQRRPFDYRVGLTPMGVEILTQQGHRVRARAVVSAMSSTVVPALRSFTRRKSFTAVPR